MLEKIRWIAKYRSRQVHDPEAVVAHHRKIIIRLLDGGGGRRDVPAAVMHALLAFSHPSYIDYLGSRMWEDETKSIIQPFVENKIHLSALKIIHEANIPDDEVVAWSLRGWVIEAFMSSGEAPFRFGSGLSGIFKGEYSSQGDLAFLALNHLKIDGLSEKHARNFCSCFANMNPRFLEDSSIIAECFSVGAKLGDLYPAVARDFFNAAVWAHLFSEHYPLTEDRLTLRLLYHKFILKFAPVSPINQTQILPLGFKQSLRPLVDQALKEIESGSFKSYPECSSSNLKLIAEILSESGFSLTTILVEMLKSPKELTGNLIKKPSEYSEALRAAYYDYFNVA